VNKDQLISPAHPTPLQLAFIKASTRLAARQRRSADEGAQSVRERRNLKAHRLQKCIERCCRGSARGLSTELRRQKLGSDARIRSST
jgi:hypothetical protein